MNNLVQVLHLEDDALDAELVRATLESAGIVCQIDRVQNRDDFTQALQQGQYDLILGDYRLPAYDGVSALRLAQELRPDLPFIFVSGTLGEDAAIDGLTQGATDYVLKQKLSRLAPAVQRALRETENRRLRTHAEAVLQERMRHSQSLLRLSRQLERAQTYREIVNAALTEVQTIIGYQNLWVYLLTADRQYCTAVMADGHMSERVLTGEGIAMLTIKGDPMLEEIAAATQIVIVEDAQLDPRTDKAIVAQLGNRTIVNVPIILFDRHLGSVGTGTFGDEGVHIPTPFEQEYLIAMASHIAVSLDRLHLSGQRRQTEEALRASEQKFRSFVQESSEGFTLVDEQGTIIEWNHAREKMTGLAASQALGRPLWDIQSEMLPPELRTPERRERARQIVAEALRTGQSPLFSTPIEAEVLNQTGERRFVQQIIFPIKTDLGYRIGSVTSDITERQRAEAERQAHLRFFASMDQINRAMQGTNDLEQMMREVLDAMLSIFECDRAWLTYPCDPETATWRASMERTRPEYPGVIPIGVELPVDPPGVEVFRILRSASGPVKFGPGSEHPVPDVMAQAFNIRSFMATAIYPKVGKPWSFGMHQCSYPRAWTSEEERLLQEIGRRLSDTLTSLLMRRNLQESELRYREIFENTSDVIIISEVTEDGRFKMLDCNPAWEKMIGYSRTAMLGGLLDEFSAIDDSTHQTLERYRQCVADKASLGHELELVTATGHWYVHTTLIPVINAAGKVYRLISVSRNITEHKRAEEALRESQALYHSFIEQLPNPVFRKDSEGRYVMVNSPFCRLKGVSAEDFLGRRPSEIARRESSRQGASGQAIKYAGQGEEAHDLIMRTGQIIETEEEHPGADGGTLWTHVIRMPVFDPAGKVVGTQGIQFDITERKRAEARILRLNRLYATLSQINQTIVHVRDRASLFEQICRVAVEYGQFRLAWIGLTDEATGQIVPVVFAGEEQGYLANLQITVRDERQGRGPTGTAIREGRCIICQDIATDPGMQPWRDAALQRGYRSTAAVPIRQNARVVGALTVYAAEPHSLDTEDEYLLDEIGLDISFALDGLEQEAQRQRAETELSRLNTELEQRVADRTAELERAHERLRAILDTAGEGVVFTDSQGAIEYINPALERLTGYTADEVLGRNPRLWKSDQTPLSTYQHMWRALLRGEIWQGELINRRKDGGLYDAALTTSPVTDLDGRTVGYVGVQRDITRQKELDRLKDQFVSNVSHELRTPLANVMLHISLLTRGRPERHDIYLRTLQREAERLRKMIEDLLDLSRLDRNVTPIELAPTDVQQLIEPLVSDRAALAAQRGLTLKYESASDLPVIATDASKLTQVISNLLTNALNYTPPGGTVTVQSAVHHTTTQQWIAITVRDTGPGIADKDLVHLFERFYRGEAGRKADAPGTGLGLAISHEIMERLGGRITVESEPGQGAAFTIWVKAEVA